MKIIKQDYRAKTKLDDDVVFGRIYKSRDRGRIIEKIIRAKLNSNKYPFQISIIQRHCFRIDSSNKQATSGETSTLARKNKGKSRIQNPRL